jgi:hypothetical protein
VVVEDVAPIDPMAAVQGLLDGLGLGNLAFSPPERMQMKEKRMVELLLSPEQSAAKLKTQLAEPGAAQAVEGIKVSPRMEAALTGPGFTVEALTPSEQILSPKGTTRWAWSVVPTAPGKQSLHLSLSARIEVEGHDAPFVVRTFDREIRVEVTRLQQVEAFVESNWQWLWALLVPPALEWWRRKRKAARG